MAKNKHKKKSPANAEASTSGGSSKTLVIGVLADDTVIRKARCDSLDMFTVINQVADDLQGHIDKTFALRDPGIKINRESVFTPGVKHEPTDNITDVAKQLPPNSYMFIIYTPTEGHGNVLTNTINRMVTDQTILKVEKDPPPWTPSTSQDEKMDQVVQLVKSLKLKVDTLEADNVAIRADNVAIRANNVVLEEKVNTQGNTIDRLRSRVADLEDQNQILQEAVTGQETALRKLRRRILLDDARKKILIKQFPNDSKATWNDLRAIMSQSEVQSFIRSQAIFARPLDGDALSMIYDGRSAVREGGNGVAHEAPMELVEDAVLHGDPQDRDVLKRIFGCVYDKDLP